MFDLGMEVDYDGDIGVIDFICPRYIRIKLPNSPERSSPRLVVYREFQDRVKIIEDNQK